MDQLIRDVGLADRSQAVLPEEVRADYSEQLAGCVLSLPFLAQKLASDIVLLFPDLELLDEMFPDLMGGLEPGLEFGLVGPDPFEQQLAHILGDVFGSHFFL